MDVRGGGPGLISGGGDDSGRSVVNAVGLGSGEFPLHRTASLARSLKPSNLRNCRSGSSRCRRLRRHPRSGRVGRRIAAPAPWAAFGRSFRAGYADSGIRESSRRVRCESGYAKSRSRLIVPAGRIPPPQLKGLNRSVSSARPRPRGWSPRGGTGRPRAPLRARTRGRTWPPRAPAGRARPPRLDAETAGLARRRR